MLQTRRAALSNRCCSAAIKCNRLTAAIASNRAGNAESFGGQGYQGSRRLLALPLATSPASAASAHPEPPHDGVTDEGGNGGRGGPTKPTGSPSGDGDQPSWRNFVTSVQYSSAWGAFWGACAAYLGLCQLKIGLANFACGLAAEGSKGGGLKEGGQQRVGSGLGDGLKDGLKDGLGTASNGR